MASSEFPVGKEPRGRDLWQPGEYNRITLDPGSDPGSATSYMYEQAWCHLWAPFLICEMRGVGRSDFWGSF